jgi:hypothetical protein
MIELERTLICEHGNYRKMDIKNYIIPVFAKVMESMKVPYTMIATGSHQTRVEIKMTDKLWAMSDRLYDTITVFPPTASQSI